MTELTNIIDFYNNCFKTFNDPTACGIRLGIRCISIVIVLSLAIHCLIIVRNRYRRKGHLKHKAFTILGLCLLLQIVFIACDCIGVRFFQLKICVQTLIFTEIFRYLYKKLQKSKTQSACKNRIFYWSLFLINIFSAVVAVLDVVNQISNYQIFQSVMELYFIASALGNVLFLIFLVFVLDMIKKFRALAITNFKFNHRTTLHFRKNQYLIQSLSLYFLSIVISSGVIKLPLNINFLIMGNTKDFYLIPRHVRNRQLCDDILQLIVKIMIFYVPMLASQRLFKEMKYKEKNDEITNPLRSNTLTEEHSTADSFGLHTESTVSDRDRRDSNFVN